jgi:glycosyltransferase involved in cell wall biosynthesis
VDLRPTVLHLLGSFHSGGSERQAVQLIRLLEASGRWRVLVACLDPGGPLRGEVAHLDIPAFPLTSFYNWNMLVQLRRFAAFLRAGGVRVVQTHDFYSNVFGMAGAALARVPARIAARRETGSMRTRAQLWMEHRTYGLAHAIVANSEAVRRRLLESGVPEKKVVVIYNGLDLARVAPQPGGPWPLPEGRRFVTMVANLRHRVKDHPMFLRAARRVRDAVPEAAFLLAGEGELLDEMRRLAADLGLERDVFFLGRCDRVAELLSISEVCVLSSSAEGFSNSILEYMAASRPVVATDVGGAREAILDGETGYGVPSGDDAAMAARIIGLLRNPEVARRMGARGRQIVIEKFSCEAQLRLTEQLYGRLLSGA